MKPIHENSDKKGQEFSIFNQEGFADNYTRQNGSCRHWFAF